MLLLVSIETHAQVEGQDFCKGLADGKYLPLDVNKKKIFWGSTYYFETKEGVATFIGHEYIVFKQAWENEKSDLIYLREEKGIVYQYREECETEFILLDTKSVGEEWKNSCFGYNRKIISLDAELKTKFCRYKNLIAVQSTYTSDPDLVHVFYYQKGYGYVGATENGKVISCVTPEWND